MKRKMEGQTNKAKKVIIISMRDPLRRGRSRIKAMKMMTMEASMSPQLWPKLGIQDPSPQVRSKEESQRPQPKHR
jgi:hypothetical protein